MQTDPNELQVAWAALANERKDSGYLSIALGSAGPRFRGGIRYPDHQEVLLVGFNLQSPPQKQMLPVGRGFKVEVSSEPLGPGFSLWVALERQPGAIADLFTQMAEDAIEALSTPTAGSEVYLLSVLIARIRAWQDFMERPRAGRLSQEEEIGLFGEVAFLEMLLAEQVHPDKALSSWVGPRGGLQDFITDTAGVEIKTNLRPAGFPVTISSLEQLDTFDGKLVLLGALRLTMQNEGRTLPSLIDDIRHELEPFPGALGNFNRSLLFAGFDDSSADEYTRSYSVSQRRIFHVGDDFPCLRRGLVSTAIRSAVYELELDMIDGSSNDLGPVLLHFGVNT
ncbi:PD-(D/E)XK motif protein [Rhizobium sp. NXC24]|uniref:PD-(D/E)XK motif protein n=1 Tax=Rhizobium sp. NXC24 TaxID=2048897 RepID=UPI000CDF3F4F|nr:PD-(D/E)XK motif protein [Rhizobium sp. NXC24]AVA21989.1 hypothetical protein NXC24_CH02352 [Rhizobium sp. NXC24]